MSQPNNAALVFDRDLLAYDFGPRHALRPERIALGLDLLRELRIWEETTETYRPFPASDDLLASVHSRDYIAAVREAGNESGISADAPRYGLAGTDNPPFPNMHHPSSLVAGGAAGATRAIMRGDLRHVFHPAGGLHHALRARASGFCIYNDPALAAAVAMEEFGARVAYVDFDCHHGDGVQWLFYDNPSVLTISFHESGRFLFPGTGGVEERGSGDGQGFSVNVPFVPFTQDASWTRAIHAILPPLLQEFAPDIVLTVHGCDTHAWDPLTHLALTTSSLVDQARLAHELAHSLCEGRWLTFGSGGYEFRRVVPRSWAIVWSEMSERPLPERVPTTWLERWGRTDAPDLPETFRDNPDTVHPVRVDEIETQNLETLDQVLRLTGLT